MNTSDLIKKYFRRGLTKVLHGSMSLVYQKIMSGWHTTWFSFHVEWVCYPLSLMAWVKGAETTAQFLEQSCGYQFLFAKNMGIINLAGYLKVN